jgi:hypothetical protein
VFLVTDSEVRGIKHIDGFGYYEPVENFLIREAIRFSGTALITRSTHMYSTNIVKMVSHKTVYVIYSVLPNRSSVSSM